MDRMILFLTGTRADFGKLKPLIREVERCPEFECAVFVTGMHTLSRYGYTVDEVYASFADDRLSDGSRRIQTYMNQIHGEPMEMILANTILGLSRYVHEVRPEMIVVHGDRVEALAGAIVGALRGIPVAHIEGGELSGTIDEVIRHSVTKLAHVHFVANEEAAARLRQLGEKPESVFVIGSPDIDVMLSPDLPLLDEVRTRYAVPFQKYGIVLYHPVTIDLAETDIVVTAMVSALLADHGEYVVIYPNNDEGCELIFSAYKRLEGHARFRLFPSLRFESFLTLLKHADFVIGNSSAGIREAPVYGIRSINLSTRQSNRFQHESILEVAGQPDAITDAIGRVRQAGPPSPSYHFGRGESARLFVEALRGEVIWALPSLKQLA